MQPNIFQKTFPGQAAPTPAPTPTPVVRATPAPSSGIDPTIKALASTIGELETGPASPDAYTKKGASGEYGRYQWMPDTYKEHARKYLGAEDAPPTMENQNKIIYDFIKEKKDSGYNPAQIMSEWNSGGKDKYKQNWRGVNSQGVAYDTPAYVQKGSAIYQQRKSALGMAEVPAPEIAPEGSFLGDAGKQLGESGTRLSKAIGDTASGAINPLSGVIQSGGAIASGISGLADTALSHIPVIGGAYREAKGLIGAAVGKVADTETGKGLIGRYEQFAQEHPELAANIGSGVDIATAVPVLKGIGLAKTAARGGVEKALYGGTDAALSTIAPRLSTRETAQAIMQRGTTKKGLLRETTLNPDPRMQDIAKAVTENVPGFNPSKPLVHNIAETQRAVTTLKKSLSADVAIDGAGKIYPVKQLIARLKSIERPDLIASDVTLNNVYDKLINRVKGIAEAQGGKVEKLPDILGDFDAMVKKQYPNLYRSESLTPLRQGVKDIREQIKTFAEEQMPNVALKERMLTVHKLLNAMENMSRKAASGGSKEVGSNVLTRLAGRHPVMKGLINTGTKAAVEGTGIGAVLRIMQ